MAAAPSHPYEQARLRSLRGYEILDTPPEAAFDDVVRLASEICGAPIAIVSFVDSDRLWCKASVGLDVRELPRSIAFCAHAILGHDLFTVPDMTGDARFADNPLVVGEPGVRFYAGAPLQAADGHLLGTLCVLDRSARKLSPFEERALRTLGKQIEAQLELRRSLREAVERSEAFLDLQRKSEELRAFVVHDLKNVVAMALPNAEYLLDSPAIDDEERSAANDIKIALERMTQTMARLLEKSAAADRLVPVLGRVAIGELVRGIERSVHRRAEEAGQRLVIALPEAETHLRADAALLRRVIENLVDNAVKYARSERGAITIEVSASPASVAIVVRDEGPGIPPVERAHVFERYVRLERDASNGGYGLGLAFCRAAVEAHGGTIVVEDAVPHGAAFRIDLPRDAAS